MKSKQTLSGYIRENLVWLEGRLYAGVSQRSIVEELAEKGFTTGYDTFRTLLHRARRRAAKRPALSPRQFSAEEANSIASARIKRPAEKSPASRRPLAAFEYVGSNVDPSELF